MHKSMSLKYEPSSEQERYAAGTFGRAYFDFMASHGFRPEGRPSVRFVDDPELA